jgi:hypothetical protein
MVLFLILYGVELVSSGVLHGEYLLGIDRRLQMMRLFGTALSWVLVVVSIVHLSSGSRFGLLGLITASLYLIIEIPRF